MRLARTLAPVFAAAALCLAVSPIVKADLRDKKTVVTFDQSTEIPGSVLPPGRYVFKLLRGGVSDRLTVQIWDGSESQIYATLHTVPEITFETPDRAYFTLDNRDFAEGLPPLLQSWFYPGDDTGWTFLYPKSQRRPADYRPLVTNLRQRHSRMTLSARAD